MNNSTEVDYPPDTLSIGVSPPWRMKDVPVIVVVTVLTCCSFRFCQSLPGAPQTIKHLVFPSKTGGSGM